jgi:hypothetical protein
VRAFWLCFLPVFVAVDALGVLPFFIALTEGLSPIQKRRTLTQSLITASIVAVLFFEITGAEQGHPVDLLKAVADAWSSSERHESKGSRLQREGRQHEETAFLEPICLEHLLTCSCGMWA